jgi:phosphatidylglycerophosphate synthase
MLDRWLLPLFSRPLTQAARKLDRLNITADQVTVGGFALGLMAVPALAFEQYGLALLLIVLNRIGDGLDGALARLNRPSDAGAYLDIVLDFIFYSGVVCGFAWADPAANALAAATLIFAFMGTGSSFLAFAILAERQKIRNIAYPSKGIYYLGGLTEGAETIAVFVLFCLFPACFAPLAYLFAALCLLTTAVRVASGYQALKAFGSRPAQPGSH